MNNKIKLHFLNFSTKACKDFPVILDHVFLTGMELTIQHPCRDAGFKQDESRLSYCSPALLGWEDAAFGLWYALFFGIFEKTSAPRSLFREQSCQAGCRHAHIWTSDEQSAPLKNAKNYMRWHIIDAYRWKCAHCCCFPFVQHCSSSISHITLIPVSQHSSLRSFITMSVKRWFWSPEFHGNIFPLCMCLCVHSRMCFPILGDLFFLTFPLRRSRRYEGVSLQWQGRDRASRQRGVGRSQEELSSSNRQRAKRMTVPSSSLSVNMIMFEPSLRSKACHTACKTVTEGVK